MPRKLTKEEALKLRQKRDAEDPCLHYVAPVTLQRAGECKARYICVHAPNQCLGAETEIYDPVAKISRRVGDIADSFHVYAWDEHAGEMVIAKALPPERIEIDELWRVTLSNGLSFVASKGHRLLCADGRWLSLAQLQPGCELYRPPSTLGNGQSIHVADGLRSSGIAQDSLAGCPSSRHSCDEQPLLAGDSVPGFSPPQVGALPCSTVAACPTCGREDGRACKPECTRACHGFSRLSTHGGQSHGERHQDQPLCQASCTDETAYPGAHPCVQPPSTFEGVQPPLGGGSPVSVRQLDETASGAISYGLRVVNVAFVRNDFKYDFEVPRHHNYLLAGSLSHNCGKTSWMQYIAASILRNKNPHWKHSQPIKILLVIPKRAQAAEVWGNRLLKACELFGPMGKFPWLPKREVAKVYNSYSPAGPYPGKIVMKTGDELVTILSGDPNSWKGLEGMTFDLVIRDEVAGNENLGDELQPRLLASRTRALAGLQPWGGVMIWSATETKHNEEWLAFKQRCIDGVDEHVYFKPQPEEAEAYISMKAREEMKSSMSAKSYRIRGEGTLDAGDLVRIYVQQWDDKRHMLAEDYVVKPDDAIFVGWDPGVQHPTGIVIAAMSKDAPSQLKIVKCFLHSNESVDYDVECIHSFMLGRKIAAFVYDWAAKAQTKNGPSVLNSLISRMDAKGYSPLAGYIQADKRVEPGIDSMRHYLDPEPFNKNAKPLLVINPSQESGGPMLRSEIMGYCKTEATPTSKGTIVKKNDDLCFAGDTPIRMADGSTKEISAVAVGDMVATPLGARRVMRSWMTSPHCAVKLYLLESGRTIVCTPDHPVFVNGSEWRPIDSARYADSLSAWTPDQNSRPSFTGASNTTAPEALSNGATWTGKASCFTAESTKTTTAQSLTDGTFTIGTGTHSTTTLPTLRRYLRQITQHSIPGTSRKPPEKPQRRGTTRQKGAHGTRSKHARSSQSVNTRMNVAIAASQELSLATSRLLSSVGTTVNPHSGAHPGSMMLTEPVFAVGSPSESTDTASSKHAADRVVGSCEVEPRPVYDLEVEDAHCFYANDILAHNCDPMRYLVRAFPYWSSAYMTGEPTYHVDAPLAHEPHRLMTPNRPLTPMELREQLSRQQANRTRASVLKMFGPRR